MNQWSSSCPIDRPPLRRAPSSIVVFPNSSIMRLFLPSSLAARVFALASFGFFSNAALASRSARSSSFGSSRSAPFG